MTIRPNLRSIERRLAAGDYIRPRDIRALIDYLRFLEVRAIRLGNLAQAGRSAEDEEFAASSTVIGEIWAAMRGSPPPAAQRPSLPGLPPPPNGAAESPPPDSGPEAQRDSAPAPETAPGSEPTEAT